MKFNDFCFDFNRFFNAAFMLKFHTLIIKGLIIFSRPIISERKILICMNSV